VCPERAPAREIEDMGNVVNDPPSETVHLMERLKAGDRRALADLFPRHRNRLRRMVELRMDARLRVRIDASDVLQGGFLNASKQVGSQPNDHNLPVFLGRRSGPSRSSRSRGRSIPASSSNVKWWRSCTSSSLAAPRPRRCPALPRRPEPSV